ncbi:MAG: glycosyltransferase family 39 protein [Chloroflexota bacterium]
MSQLPSLLRRPLYSLAGIFLIYAALSLIQLNLPGLHYDEAFEAVPALDLLLGRPVTTFRHSGLPLGNQLFPLMTQDYIGALNTYAVLPFIAVLGSTPLALRLMSVLVGAGTLWLTYKLGAALTGERGVGLAAALLLAVDPTFIYWNRQGIFVTAVTAMIGLAATLGWRHRRSSGSMRGPVSGAFLFGLGLYAKFLFVWLIAALVGAVVLLNLKELRRTPASIIQRWRPRRLEILLLPPAFLLGCWPLVLYNLQTGGTFLSITQNAQISYYGVNNLAFGPNLLERLNQFITVLNGSHLWYLGEIISNPLPPLGFVLVLVGVAFIAGQKPQSGPPLTIALFPFLVIGLALAASIGTVSALWVTHFALLLPWPALALAVGGWFIYRRLELSPPRKFQGWAGPILWLGLAALVVSNLWSSVRYQRALAVSGGLSTHSDAIYDLSQWLDTQAPGSVAAMDWGLAAPVTYLTHGRVSPIETFGYAWEESGATLTGRLARFMARPETLYLWRAPDEIIFDRSPEFKALYRPLQLEETIEEAFYERSGRPLLGVTRLVPRGTAENPPK